MAVKENLFFGYFYFTAEKVKSIFGRPLGTVTTAINEAWSIELRQF